MPRIRTIKPEFWQDEKLARCSPHSRLLAIALLQLCDASGIFRYIPMQIHAHAFPWEAEVNLLALLRELEEIGYVFFYESDGKKYGCIPGFAKHQRLSGKEAQSDGIYPKPDQGVSLEYEDIEAKGNSTGSEGEFNGKRRGRQEQGTGNREQGTGIGESVDPPKGERNRDEIWESMLEVCGLAGKTPTKSARGAWNRAAKDLREVGATPAEITRRAAAFREVWPNVSLTPTALARRWDEVVADKSSKEMSWRDAI